MPVAEDGSIWCKAEGNWDVEGVELTPGQRGWSHRPRRWVGEPTCMRR
jgi:hypothetical protein